MCHAKLESARDLEHPLEGARHLHRSLYSCLKLNVRAISTLCRRLKLTSPQRRAPADISLLAA